MNEHVQITDWMTVLWVTVDKELLTISLILSFMRPPGIATWDIYQNLYAKNNIMNQNVITSNCTVKKEAFYSYVEFF